MKKFVVILLLIVHAPSFVTAQTKQINDQWQSWTSLNSTFRTSEYWGFVGDLHIRRTEFLR